MFGRVPKNAAALLGTRPNISESHSEISTRVPFCIAAGFGNLGAVGVQDRGAQPSSIPAAQPTAVSP